MHVTIVPENRNRTNISRILHILQRDTLSHHVKLFSLVSYAGVRERERGLFQ